MSDSILKIDELINHYEYLDLLIPDCNGVIRGKRLPVGYAKKVFSQGVLFPASLFAADICGEPCEETQLGFEIGDADYNCPAILETLVPVPWAPKRAQVLLDMLDDDGRSFAVNPREVLKRLLERLASQNILPTVAVELEFYLLSPDCATEPQAPVNPITGAVEKSSQVYYMDDLDAYGDFIDAIQKTCEQQNIFAEAAISECSPGQFEINLTHSDDPLKACDDAILLKRAIKNVARQCGYTATFMAKPYGHFSGSGTHVHTSLYNRKGENIFAQDERHLRWAIAGLQNTMAEAMLMFSPHANSFRRFQPNSYVALNNSWGYNNRTVALRVPVSDDQNKRVEHRIAGADANPYLVVAAVLAGLHKGLMDEKDCTEAISGNAYKQTKATNPNHWQAALAIFEQSQWVSEYFGETFHKVFTAIKHAEINRFNRHVSPLECEWYLQTV